MGNALIARLRGIRQALSKDFRIELQDLDALLVLVLVGAFTTLVAYPATGSGPATCFFLFFAYAGVSVTAWLILHCGLVRQLCLDGAGREEGACAAAWAYGQDIAFGLCIAALGAGFATNLVDGDRVLLGISLVIGLCGGGYTIGAGFVPRDRRDTFPLLVEFCDTERR